jgi:hypothetical protein
MTIYDGRTPIGEIRDFGPGKVMAYDLTERAGSHLISSRPGETRCGRYRRGVAVGPNHRGRHESREITKPDAPGRTQ